MEGLTLLLAIVLSVLIITLPLKYWPVLFLIGLAWYPSNLTLKIDTMDFSLCRILILAVYIKIFMSNILSSFKLILLDKLIIVYMLAQIVAGAFTSGSFGAFLEYRIGMAFDLLMPYFAIRITLRQKSEYITILRGMLLVAAPLACLGLYQSITGVNLFAPLKAYAAWGSTEVMELSRLGLYRANVTFSICILFGLFFSTLGPVCIGLLLVSKRLRFQHICGILLTIVGVISSVSSGPILGVLLSYLFIMFYHYRRHWKAVTTIIIICCLIIEVLSNRHFYDVLGGLTLSPQTAWYRSRLISVALFEHGMSGRWIFGYGYGIDPGWSAKIDSRSHTDIVNHFLCILSFYGMVGLLPFLAVVFETFRSLVKAFHLRITNADRWLVWCLTGSIFGVVGAMNTVSLFGQINTVFYMVLGMCGSMPGLMRNVAAGLQASPVIYTLKGSKFPRVKP